MMPVHILSAVCWCAHYNITQQNVYRVLAERHELYRICAAARNTRAIICFFLCVSLSLAGSLSMCRRRRARTQIKEILKSMSDSHSL